jgi:hypothetical protein
MSLLEGFKVRRDEKKAERKHWDALQKGIRVDAEKAAKIKADAERLEQIKAIEKAKAERKYRPKNQIVKNKAKKVGSGVKKAAVGYYKKQHEANKKAAETPKSIKKSAGKRKKAVRKTPEIKMPEFKPPKFNF